MRYNISNQHPTAPFIYGSIRASYQDNLLLVLLTLQIIVMGLMHDFSGIMVLVCAALGAYAAGILTNESDNKYRPNPQILIAGLLTGFFLPNDIGFLFSFIIACIGYFLSRGIFGGKGGSWINPVALAVCIASICKPDCFSHLITTEQIAQSGSVFNAFTAAGFSHISADQSVTSMLNTSFLHRAGVTLPQGYITMLISFPSKIPAFRYNIITLASSVLILSIKGIQKTLVFTFLGVYGALIWFFPITQGIHGYAQGDILYAWLTGGTFFAAFFIITDTGTLPRSNTGRFVSGLLLAVFAFFVARPTASQAGIPFAILSANCLTPLIEQVETLCYKKMRAL